MTIIYISIMHRVCGDNMAGQRICFELQDEMLEQTDELVRRGLFSNRAEVAKNGIRNILKEFSGGV